MSPRLPIARPLTASHDSTVTIDDARYPTPRLVVEACQRLGVDPARVRPPYDCPQGMVACPVCAIPPFNGEFRTVARHKCTKFHRERVATVLGIDVAELKGRTVCKLCSATGMNGRPDTIVHTPECNEQRKQARKGQKFQQIQTRHTVSKPLNTPTPRNTPKPNEARCAPPHLTTAHDQHDDPTPSYPLLPPICCQPPIAPLLPPCSSFDSEQLAAKMANRSASEVLKSLSENAGKNTEQSKRPGRRYRQILPRPEPHLAQATPLPF